ncbi:flotillin-like protein 4 [Quercus suber]|uniref:Flotillin-like protein 4 n=1 Tax=Quercus suber TaxID=58331 RepID=A0AAW0KX63_QUESU
MENPESPFGPSQTKKPKGKGNWKRIARGKGKRAQGVSMQANENLLGSKRPSKLDFSIKDYMMVNKNVYQDIARNNAQAMNGMQPKISVWSNGKGSEGSYGPMKDTVHEQAGLLPPAWLATLNDATQ